MFMVATIVTIIGCSGKVNLVDNPAGLNAHQHETVQLMASAAKNRCITYEYEQANPDSKLSGDKSIQNRIVIYDLSEGNDGWYRGDAIANGIWDRIYFQRTTGALVCGDIQWAKHKKPHAVSFTSVGKSKGSTTSSVPREVATVEERSIALRWDGLKDLIAGRVKLLQSGQQGEFEFVFPINSDRCKGLYQVSNSHSGVWSLACASGLTARGDLETLGNGKGSTGSGKDNEGRTVQFTIGEAH